MFFPMLLAISVKVAAGERDKTAVQTNASDGSLMARSFSSCYWQGYRDGRAACEDSKQQEHFSRFGS